LSSNRAVQVLCPTGNSANIISGVTLHRFLNIPIHIKGQEMKPPEGTLGEKQSYKQVNQVLGITEHHPLEK
jgi:hypothetical protein